MSGKDGMKYQVGAQHKFINNFSSFDISFSRTTHPDAQWFPEAGLGLFIHWGINSVWGMGDISWCMLKSKPGILRERHEKLGIGAHWVNIRPVDYWRLAEKFNPESFDPDKILKAAKDAGCRYAVLTTRHHDGFAMWPSKFGNFNTSLHMKGRDLVKEYVDACRRQGLKVGLYYSPPDWYFNQKYMSFSRQDSTGVDHEPYDMPDMDSPEKHTHDRKFTEYLRGQVKELLTNYGEIDLMWFDGSCEDAFTVEEIRAFQPGIVLNPRAWGCGDYLTPEGVFPEKRIDGWWEFCTCFCNGGWGYVDNEIHFPSGWFLENLCKVRSWDGNFLPSTGPDGNGVMPEIYYKRMKQIAGWMAHSKDSVFGVKGFYGPEEVNVPVTCRENKWYVHVHWLWDMPVEIKTARKPLSVKLLRNGVPIAFTQNNGNITFTVPIEFRTNLDDVVEIIWQD